MRPTSRRRDALVLAIKEAILERFDDSDWKDLGYLTGASQYVNNHPRLLRSYRFGDDDYPGNVLDALEHILSTDRENLKVLLDDKQIQDWLHHHRPDLFVEFVGDLQSQAIEAPQLAVTSITVDRALSDAETLIRTSGATSAVDRVHTALHGYLIAVCDESGVSYEEDASITKLFKALRSEHPALQDLGPRPDDVTAVLRSLSNVIDKLNPARNQHSLAHPNPVLLDEPEALFVINSARTVLHYLNDKFSAEQDEDPYPF